MLPDLRFAGPLVRETRDRVIAQLQEHFAHGILELDEFERRVTQAHRSESALDIDALVADLPPMESTSSQLVPATTRSLAGNETEFPSQTIKGLMSATTRGGTWGLPRRLNIRALMSSVVLDLREARFPPGFVDVDVRAVMSSVEIIVPPCLAVETNGSAIMGTFEHVHRAPTHPDLEAPILRVTGRAILSSVEVRMALPWESQDNRGRRAVHRPSSFLPGRQPSASASAALGPLKK